MLDEQHLQEQAERCRRLAREIGNEEVGRRLTLLAEEYEDRARLMQAENLEARSFAPRDGAPRGKPGKIF
jgi:hypothetical protein